MQPSRRQIAIFEAVKSTTANLAIEAVAGSGKTRTLLWILQYLRGTALFCAFNSHIRDELSLRAEREGLLRPGVEIKTLHQWGKHSLEAAKGKRWPGGDKGKTIAIAARVLGDKYHPLIGGVKALAEKGMDYVADTAEKLIEVAARHRIEAPDCIEYQGQPVRFTIEDLAFYAAKVMALSVKELTTISFGDMGYATVKLGVPMLRYDNILVDECQDLGPVQAAMIRRAVAQGSRLIMVGDSYQSIYAFRGVEQGGFAALKAEFKATELPLDITYRCPASHVRLVQALVPHIKAAAGAPEGILEQVNTGTFFDEVAVGDMVLCRVTAELVTTVFSLLRAGKKAFIQGRDIGTELLNFVKRFKARDLEDLVSKVTQWASRECAKLEAAGDEDKAQAARDKADAVLAIATAHNVESLEDLVEFIETIFRDDGDGKRICLSTVHKAKGLEAQVVWILRGDLMPHPMAKTDEDIQQENNIAYVAMTRSKLALRFVGAIPGGVDGSMVVRRQRP